jgi:hypothetical protein
MKKNKQITLFIQFVLFVVSAILLFIGLFEKAFFCIGEISWALTLLVMAYNNHFYFKRKFFTILYIVGAIVLILAAMGIGL